MSLLHPLFRFDLLSLLFVTISATCFYPNGSPVTDQAYAPCNAVVGVASMCCAIVPLGDALGFNSTQLDKCLPNGLCAAADGTFWRDACTDSTWTSPNCRSNLVCPDQSGAIRNTFQVTMCPTDSKWCCGAMDPQACCLNNNRVSAADINVGTTTTGSATSTIISSTITSTTTASTAASTTTANAAMTTNISQNSTKTPDPQPSDNNVAIGVGVGVGVGGSLIIIIVAAFIIRQRRRRSTTKGWEKPELSGDGTLRVKEYNKNPTTYYEVATKDPSTFSEMSTRDPRTFNEMPVREAHHELPGTGRFRTYI